LNRTKRKKKVGNFIVWRGLIGLKIISSAKMSLANDQLKHFAPVIKATGAYAALYFSFASFQSFSKFYLFHKENQKTDSSAKKSIKEIKYDSKDGLGLVSDRTFLNMVEQAPMFLTALWMHAVFVCPKSAAKAAYWYIGFRSIYPFCFMKGSTTPWIALSTFPNYFTVWYLIGTTCFKACKASKAD
jgi:hypothetical protein